MVRQRYSGLVQPEKAFAELEPYYRRLAEMARAYHPSSAEHHAIEHARLTLRTAAELITKQPYGRDIGSSDTGSIGAGWKG